MQTKTARVKVYAAIDQERSYQDSRWTELDKVNSIGDFIAYMHRYLNEATNAVNPNAPEKSLDAIRKVTALGVACMEIHGVMNRQ